MKTFDDWYALAHEYYEEHGNLLVPVSYVSPDGSKLGRWISRIRNAYIYTGSLSIEQVRMLEKIGMVWQPRTVPKKAKKTKDFDDWYSLAKEYYETNGNLLVPQSYISSDGSKLGRWIERMRAAYNGKINKSLTLTEIAMLEKIGMMWKLENRFSFEEWILQCKLYRAAHGDLLVPKSYVNADYALGEWIIEQRKQKRRGKLDEKRAQELESLGMIWEVADRSLWMRTYECARDYLATHTEIPKSYLTEDGIYLREWLILQKSNYRLEVCDSKRDFEKHDLLSIIGVTWEDEPRKPARGYEYAARQYFLEHGNLNVPEGFLTEDGLDLYAWVKKNWVTYHWPRENKRKQELEALGFDWSLEGKWDWDPKEKQWLENFNEIKEYIETKSCLPIKEHSITLSSGIDSGNWIKYNLQRKIAPEKVDLLKSVGIERRAVKKKNIKGFTLVELIVVLVILAILAAMLIPALTGYIDKARNTQLIVMAKSLYTATQAVTSEAYASGEFTIEGKQGNTKTSLPDITKIIALSELKDTGDAGQNYALLNAGTTGIVNGFGHGANTNANNKKSNADYHFKALISEAGSIEEFVVCDGKKYATYKNGEFEVTKSTCTDNHSGHKLYNYIVLDKDNGAATFANLFMQRGSF